MRTSRTKPDIGREVADIVASAQSGVARVVGLGPLILFSTETGDAWLLDWEDDRALCLARGGAAQQVNITDTESQFAIEWLLLQDRRRRHDVRAWLWKSGVSAGLSYGGHQADGATAG